MPTFRNKFKDLVTKGKDIYTIQEIIDHFKEDSIFALLFLITFPTSIPAPPQAFGAETVFGGSVSLLLSIQLIMGFNKPILPNFITSKKINMGYLKNNKYYNKADALLVKLETVFKKRYTFMFNRFFIKIIALFIIPPAILMIIPLIFTNLFPSIAVTLIAFSFLLKDGLMMMVVFFLTILMSLVYIVFFNYIVKVGKRFIMRREKKKALNTIKTSKKKIKKTKRILRKL